MILNMVGLYVLHIPSHSIPWQGAHSKSGAELLERQESIASGYQSSSMVS